MNNSPFEKLNHRRLSADEIELRPRIVEAQKGSYYAELSFYLKVQTVRKVLNEIFGIENWMCRDYEVKGKDFCEISIRNPETGEWIAKGGCGGESNFFEAGKAEGKALGMAEGRTEGIAEGRVEGRTEEKIEIARKMLEKGSDVSFISECTGLSIDEINNIEN